MNVDELFTILAYIVGTFLVSLIILSAIILIAVRVNMRKLKREIMKETGWSEEEFSRQIKNHTKNRSK